jgi:streptomycin 6-kinase
MMPPVQLAIPARLGAKWAIATATTIADTRSSLVYRVERHDAPVAIVKILKPDGMNELSGMAFLDWRNGLGAIRLLDRDQNACLIEDAGDLLLRHYHSHFGDDPATDIVLDVLGRLHAVSSVMPPDGLVPLRDHFVPLFEEAQRRANPALAETLRWTAALADNLLREQTDPRPLHGDLHHDNIIGGGPRGWLAIDPHGLMGDPAYEVSNIFGNPLGATREILDPGRVARLAFRFCEAIGCCERKILRYAAAHAGLSICWSLADAGLDEAKENITERLSLAGIVRRMLEERSA